MRLAAIGECMLELRHREPALLELGFAGDSFNTALYLARLNPPERLAVDYLTALGDDPYSDAMLAAWREEGIGIDRVARLPGRLPGLYLIRTDERGERRFFYYRSAAAARALFGDGATKPLLAVLPEYDVLYFTAVTLSILGAEARAALQDALTAARRAGRLTESEAAEGAAPAVADKLRQAAAALAVDLGDAPAGRMDVLPDTLAATLAAVRDAADACADAIQASAAAEEEDPQRMATARVTLASLDEL